MKQTEKILQLLWKKYPKAAIFLQQQNIWELAVATILSAQCTDARVNQVTQKLFRKYKKLDDYVNAKPSEFEMDIRSTGFYKNKTKNILAAAKKVKTDFNGMVPKSMEQLITIPGIGRKTANIILSQGFHQNEGIAVDTHVTRVSFRLHFTKNRNPEKIEQDLLKRVPQKDWDWLSTSLIQLGREFCFARKPDCKDCFLNRVCPSAFKVKGNPL